MIHLIKAQVCIKKSKENQQKPKYDCWFGILRNVLLFLI